MASLDQIEEQSQAQQITEAVRAEQQEGRQAGSKQSKLLENYGYKPKVQPIKNPYESIISFEKEDVPKVYKKTPDSNSGVLIRETGVEIAGGKVNRVIVSEEFGVIIKGKVGFTNLPEDVQFGGLWKFNSQLISTVPSTIMSPVPTLDFGLPALGMAVGLRKILTNLGPFFATAATAAL